MLGDAVRTGSMLLVLLVLIAVVLSGCTLNASSDDDATEQIVTATLSITEPATLAAVIQTSIATYTPTPPPVLVIEPSAPTTLVPTATATVTAAPTDTPTATATLTPTVPPTDTLAPTVLPLLTPTVTSAAQEVSQADIDATVVTILEATNIANTATAAAMPTTTATATLTATVTPPPSLTPLPTAIPPTRTHSGPPTVIPFDDGSGDLIPGTGGTTNAIVSPIPGLDALPHTLYYLSDAGNVNQVFRLQVGLPYPEQLTYSATGVRAFDVAPDGTLAYITGQGEMVIGGLPFLPPASSDGSMPQVSALAWSPDGNQLAYTLYTSDAELTPPGQYPADGLWLRNTNAGTTALLVVNVYANDATLRIFSDALEWRPDGTELLAEVTINTEQGIPRSAYHRVNITARTLELIPDTLNEQPADYLDVHWSDDGEALIVAAGDGRIWRITPASNAEQLLISPDQGYHPCCARQAADQTVTFVDYAADGAQLYRLVAGSTQPIPIAEMVINGTLDFLRGADGALMVLRGAFELKLLTAPLWFESSGVQYELFPLTGLVGAPQWGPSFKKNDQARVHITSDPLNVRTIPGGDWVASLTDGVQVTILDGPVEQDGYTWWQIRVANGVTGWSVEAITEADGSRLQTLQPIPK